MSIVRYRHRFMVNWPGQLLCQQQYFSTVASMGDISHNQALLSLTVLIRTRYTSRREGTTCVRNYLR